MPEQSLVYFVDDEQIATQLFKRSCRQLEYRCEIFNTARDCLIAVRRRLPALVVTDLNMPELDGYDLVRKLAKDWPEIPILAVTGESSVERAVQAMQAGASDFLKKPYELKELDLAMRRCLRLSAITLENQRLKQQLANGIDGHGMVGNSAAMHDVYRKIEKLALVDCPVIIQGPSGSGKELAARAIHNQGPRKKEPFVVIDCGAMTDTLLESELFGHKKGAFTGADHDRTGLLESAGAGTVLLDEIGNISDAMQTKLLRVLQEKSITPVGDSRAIKIGARFIASSHQNLLSLVENGKFRHDLYHRLDVVTLILPPLSARSEDLPLLIEHFTAEFADKYQHPLRRFTTEMMQRLCSREWKGNVRELRNLIERCVIMAEGEYLDAGELGAPSAPWADMEVTVHREQEGMPDSGSALPTLEEMEARYIEQVLKKANGNQRQAAAILGINRTTLWRKLQAD